MKMSRPKNGQYSGILFTHIQTTLIDTISHPTFTVQFPPLDPGSWNRLLTPHSAENERLEFVGDSIIDSVLSDQLYSQLPAGTPGQYTVSSAQRRYGFTDIVAGCQVRTSLKSNFWSSCNEAGYIGPCETGYFADRQIQVETPCQTGS